MHNWSVDEAKLKQHPEEYAKWRLEQLINFGLDGEKLTRDELRRYLPDLNIDPHKRRYLEFLMENN